MKRTKNIEELLLHLKGLSTGDSGEALAALLKKNAAGVSAANISRFKDAWSEELKEWQKRSLKSKESNSGLMEFTPRYLKFPI